MRSSCAHGSRCPFWRRTAAAAVHSPVHIGRFYRSCHRAGRLYKSRCAHCALIVLDAPFGVGPPRRRCALAVHIGRLYTALTIAQGDRQVKMCSICSWFSMPSFASDPPSLSSRRPPLGTRTFIPLLSSYRAISQVETRSLCAHGTRCPSLASDRCRAAVCALAVYIRR